MLYESYIYNVEKTLKAFFKLMDLLRSGNGISASHDVERGPVLSGPFSLNHPQNIQIQQTEIIASKLQLKAVIFSVYYHAGQVFVTYPDAH